MKTRATLALAAIAGLPMAVQAQETFSVVYSWQEVQAGSTNLVGAPNSVVDPGEGARIRIFANALINGANAIGQTINYTNPAPGGTGTVKGLGAVVWDLVGDANGATANGTWSSLLGPGAPLTSGASPGTAQPGGSSLHGFGGSQFIIPGGTASGTNNIQMMRSVWTPTAYSNRTVNFLARLSVLVPTGQGAGILLSYGQSTALDPNGDPYTFDLLAGKYFSISAGAGLNIPIQVPAPSSLALLGLGAVVAGGRRRS
jgi:hypothetical protein